MKELNSAIKAFRQISSAIKAIETLNDIETKEKTLSALKSASIDLQNKISNHLTECIDKDAVITDDLEVHYKIRQAANGLSPVVFVDEDYLMNYHNEAKYHGHSSYLQFLISGKGYIVVGNDEDISVISKYMNNLTLLLSHRKEDYRDLHFRKETIKLKQASAALINLFEHLDSVSDTLGHFDVGNRLGHRSDFHTAYMQWKEGKLRVDWIKMNGIINELDKHYIDINAIYTKLIGGESELE